MHEPDYDARERKAIEMLSLAAQESDVTGLSNDQLARKKLIDASSVAADQIVQLALTGSEPVRLQASRYIVDRVFGKVTEVGFIESSNTDPLANLVRALKPDNANN